MKTWKKVLCVSVALTGTFTVQATPSIELATPTSQKHADAAVEYRQAIFQLLRSNMAPLGGMAKGAIPYNSEIMQTNALRIEQLSLMLYDYMLMDTREFDVDSDAKDEIWQDYPAFGNKIDALRKAAVQLQQIAAAEDESAYKQAIGNLGGSCKSCHDDFKKE